MTEGGRKEGCKWRDQIRGCGDFLLSKNEDQVGRWCLGGKWVSFWVGWVEGWNESGIGEGEEVTMGGKGRGDLK